MENAIPEFVLTKDTLPIIRQMAENIPGGFFVYKDTEKAEIIFVNSVVLEMFGCGDLEEFKALTGYSFNGMVHPEDFIKIQSSIDLQIDRSEKNQDYVEYRILRKDGSVRYIEDYGHFATAGDYGNVYYVFIADVTEKHKAQMSRNELITSLADDIIVPLMEAGECITNIKNNVSNDHVVSDNILKLEEAYSYLNGLAKEIHENSDISQRTVAVKEVTCNTAVEGANIRKMFMYKESHKRQELILDMPSENVYMDPVLFQRVFDNIISGAFNNSSEDSIIEVKGKILRRSDTGFARFEFTVSYNLYGMIQESFDHFKRALDNDYRQDEGNYIGAGIGFGYVQKIINVMGGTIKVTCNKDRIVTVKIYLPFKVYDESFMDERYEVYDDQYLDGYKGRVLVVEDNEEDGVLIEEILSENDYKIECVADGCDAVETFKRHKEGFYDMIITCLHLPVMTGYEAIRKIRSLDREDAGKVLIYAISSEVSKEDKVIAAESGANGYVPMPLNPQELLKIVNENFL
ncbi:MAG: response regulator [Butyrivibrio sp.]|nr:response regulator [Butyrivibrio sp.]